MLNYKSIAAASVKLPQVSLLVGPNGSGKSNFLDALRFVADALNTSRIGRCASVAASTWCNASADSVLGGLDQRLPNTKRRIVATVLAMVFR